MVCLCIGKATGWMRVCSRWWARNRNNAGQLAPQMAGQLRQYTFDLLVFLGGRYPRTIAELCQQLTELCRSERLHGVGNARGRRLATPLLENGSIACVDMDSADPVGLVHTVRRACELVALRGQHKTMAARTQRLEQRMHGMSSGCYPSASTPQSARPTRIARA